ncbi:hypothetical protein [Algoriphagus terrigena]|uniref:hypothetical protein n=1 Tax=Algoriphagus terrigena TaxID=344884 RepID=UPI000412E86D|nr:hypothetical protein [Algoriphagus terrigena]
MNLRNKSIVLVDQLMDPNSETLTILKSEKSKTVLLDPVKLFSESDWTRFEKDVDVINKIYSRVFEEVVIANKKLVCFWPLSEQFGSDWFDLTSLCKINNYELEVYKGEFFETDNYGLNSEILHAWKRFVFFLIESLLEDVELNEELEEIATLTSGREAIVLFKMEQEGKTRYTFALNSESLEFTSTGELTRVRHDSWERSFESFREMLVGLSRSKDLTDYQTTFVDPTLEKAYFNILAREFKTRNLIESWILTYSLN